MPIRLLCLIVFLAPLQARAELVKLDIDVGFDSVYLMEDAAAPAITVALTVLAGEADVTGPEGLSHYLEHLVFWHADDVGNQQAHARGGNAWVNGIVSSYYNEGEAGELDNMLNFARRVFEPPALAQDFMIRERSVVAREYDLRVSENPDSRIRTDIRRKLYNNLPPSRSVIGTLESIHALTIGQALEFHGKYYHPGNSVLLLSGNLGREEAGAAVKRHFSNIKPGRQLPAQWRTARFEETSNTTREFVDAQVQHERLIYLTLSDWPEGQSDMAKWYTLWVLRSVLDSALEGGLARPLRMDNFVVRSFDLYLSSALSGYFEFEFFAEPDRGVSLAEATVAIADALLLLATTGIQQGTLDRVRSRLLQTQQRKDDNTESHYDRMSAQLSAGLSPATSKEHLDYIRQVRLDDVNELLRALAQPVRRSVAHISPKGE